MIAKATRVKTNAGISKVYSGTVFTSAKTIDTTIFSSPYWYIVPIAKPIYATIIIIIKKITTLFLIDAL